MAPTPDMDAIFVERLSLGPAAGLRVAVKDCIDVAGVPTRCGSAAFDGAAPAAVHAPVIAAMLAAGCRVVGKTNMHELAYGMTGANARFGTPANPTWPDRIPGGSSSGSAAAVAAGLADVAVGTDTGGSIRQPAICCGVYGIKPTYGRISRAGMIPAASSLDCPGVLARDMATLIRGMAAMDPAFAPETLTEAPRLARIRCTPEPAVGQPLVYALMEGLPELDFIDLPFFDEAFAAGMTVMGAECAEAFGALLDEGAPLGADIAARLTAARMITPEAVAAAEAVRKDFTDAVDAALSRYDAIITPAMPSVPPTWAEAQDPATVLPLTRFMRPFNLSGHPAIAAPARRPGDGLPIGLQIVGRKGHDARLCAIAEWLAASLPAFATEDA